MNVLVFTQVTYHMVFPLLYMFVCGRRFHRGGGMCDDVRGAGLRRQGGAHTTEALGLARTPTQQAQPRSVQQATRLHARRS